mgnify:CR=1 FL=1
MENSNYNHTSIEDEIYNYWEKNKFFKPQKNNKKHFYIFSAGEAGKVKRIRNFSSVKVAICDFKGNLRGEWISAQAELIDEEEFKMRAYRLLHKKYGLTIKVFDFFSKLFGKYNQRQLIKFKIQDSKN